MIKAVILDLDDTLCLTEEACFRLENEALSMIGRPPMKRSVHIATWGQKLFEAIETRSPGVDVEKFKAAFFPLLKKGIDEGQLDKISEENIETLRKLAKINKSLLVLTSREHGEISHMLEKTHVLAPLIETFYYKDNMTHHKPDPKAFEHIEKIHGWKPEECLYVGDSVSDAAAAKGAGLHFVASLESGLRSREDFSDHPVDDFIAKFTDLFDAVQRLDVRLRA